MTPNSPFPVFKFFAECKGKNSGISVASEKTNLSQTNHYLNLVISRTYLLIEIDQEIFKKGKKKGYSMIRTHF